jgi:cell division protein FtsQ
LQSVINSRAPTFQGWQDEVRFIRASRESFSRGAQAMFAAARRVPERSSLGWFERRADLLSKLGFLATILFYGATAAYGVTLTSRWEEVQRITLTTANQLALAAGLGIAKVSVEGRNHVTEAQIADAVGVKPGVSIFAFDTAAARERLLQNGWVREARVMRLLPSTLVVELEERSPYAIWRDGSESAVIDGTGRVLAEIQPADFPMLPTVSGPGAASPAKEIVEMIRSHPELAAHIRNIDRVAGRRWDLLLDTGLRTKLPAGYPKAALDELNDMLARNPAALYELSEIDLRVATQFTLRLKDSSDDGRKKFMSWFTKAKASREGTL